MGHIGLKMVNKTSGEETHFDCTKQSIALYAIANAEMLLKIALGDPDKRIEEKFGGEHGILQCIEGYLAIYDWAQEDECNDERPDNDGWNGWIDVNERLPELIDGGDGTSENVLVLVRRPDGFATYYDAYVGYCEFDDEGATWRTCTHNKNGVVCGESKVVAWKPIPELPTKLRMVQNETV